MCRPMADGLISLARNGKMSEYLVASAATRGLYAALNAGGVMCFYIM